MQSIISYESLIDLIGWCFIVAKNSLATILSSLPSTTTQLSLRTMRARSKGA